MVEIYKNYPDRWVAIDTKSGKVVGSDTNATVAYKQAQTQGVQVPLLTRIPKDPFTYVLAMHQLANPAWLFGILRE